MKKSLRVVKHVNPNIMVGDKVKVFDGSAISYIDNDCNIIIINAYPNITGLNEKLKYIVGEVVQTGVSDYIMEGAFNARLQDIVVKLGNGLFRTCSEFVKRA